MKADLIFFTLFLHVSVAYGLKCYQCLTTKGWDECEKIQTEVTCERGTNTCSKGSAEGKSYEVSTSFYAKGCAYSSSQCTAKSTAFCNRTDPSLIITDCQVSCCSEDLCNGAQVRVISVIFLLVCAAVAIFC